MDVLLNTVVQKIFFLLTLFIIFPQACSTLPYLTVTAEGGAIRPSSTWMDSLTLNRIITRSIPLRRLCLLPLHPPLAHQMLVNGNPL